MQKKGWIGLEGMEFYAYHGVYEEERQIGGKYEVDVWVYADTEGAELHDELSGTVNYEKIFAVVSKQMNVPVKLIEHLARKIIDDVRLFVSETDIIKIRVKKIHPPLGAEVAASVIEIIDGEC